MNKKKQNNNSDRNLSYHLNTLMYHIKNIVKELIRNLQS